MILSQPTYLMADSVIHEPIKWSPLDMYNELTSVHLHIKNSQKRLPIMKFDTSSSKSLVFHFTNFTFYQISLFLSLLNKHSWCSNFEKESMR